MTEMTPEKAETRVVREGYCYLCEADLNEGRGHRDYCPWPNIRAAQAADLKTRELERQVSDKRGRLAIERAARIEALEKQNMVYRAGLLEENGLVLKQQTRIEALEKARTLKSDFIALWKLACPCGVITAADREEWDRLQDVGAALAAEEAER